MTSLTFPALFEARAAEVPEAIALADGRDAWSYRALDAAANRLAHRLREAGVGPEQVVAVALPRGAPLVLCELAVLKAGGAFMPLDVRYPRERIAVMLEDARPCCVLADFDTAGQLPPQRPPLLLVDEALQQSQRLLIAPRAEPARPAPHGGSRKVAEPHLLESERPAVDVGAHHMAYVIYTSGSTGRPKGVVTTHAGIAAFAGFLAQRLALQPGARVAQIASPSFDASVMETLMAFGSGAALVALDPTAVAGEPLAQQLERHGISHALIPPATLATLPAGSCPGLRVLAVGGEACSGELVARWSEGRSMINAYGPTEATVCVAMSGALRAGAPIPLGTPPAGTRLLVLDAQLRQVPPGVTGELYVAGTALARGYLRRAALTAERFVANPYGPPGSRMYRTGDAVRRRRDQSIEFMGRVDHQVKLRGFRIELGEIESALGALPGVTHAAVTLREDRPGDARLVAYAVLRAGTTADPAGWRAALARTLPEHMVPACYVVLDAPPLTPNGKLDRVALPVPPEAATPAASGRPLRGPIEEKLGALYAQVLGLPAVNDAHADFFALGGHSLLAIQLGRRIRETLRADFPVAGVYTKPVLWELALLLESHAPQAPEDLDLERDSRLPDALATTLQAGVRSAPAEGPLRCVFLTGGTGYVGTHVLARLLGSTPATVVCHVRTTDATAGRRRLREALRGQGLEHWWADERIEVVTGNLAQPELGLDEAAVRLVLDACDALLHCGAHVEFLHPYAHLKAANVDSVLTLLRWSLRGRPKRLHHVSTLGIVDPSQQAGPIGEDVPVRHWRGLVGGYNQSKWVADTLVQRAQTAGLPAALYRLGSVTGDREHARCNADDVLWRVVRLCATLQAVPDIDLVLNMTPVDDVAAAIVALAGSPASMGQTFHLLSGQALTLTDVADALEAIGGERVRRLAMEPWVELAREHLRQQQDDDLQALMAILSRHEHAGPRGRIVGEATQRQLQRLGQPMQPVSPALLVRYLDQLGIHERRKAVTP
jgi:nonribosomal peptide synthetase DhbF